MRIGVIAPSQKATDRPERYVSKNAANALVRRLLAVKVSKSLIRMVEIRAFMKALPAIIQVAPMRSEDYQHHIEPRIERFTSANSEWMRYLES